TSPQLWRWPRGRQCGGPCSSSTGGRRSAETTGSHDRIRACAYARSNARSYSNLSSAQPHTQSHNVAAEELFHARRRINRGGEHTATIGSTAEPGRRPLGSGVDPGFLNGDSVRVGPNCHRPREPDSCRKRAFAKPAPLTCPEAD